MATGLSSRASTDFMKKITLLLLSAVVAFSQSLPLPKATEAQARAGTDNNTVMTPLRTKQAIEENGGSGTVTSVNGNTGAVTVQPLPTYAALASDALTLGHDNIIRTATLTGTKNLTLSSGGSTGDWRELSFDMPGATYTVTTDFAVYRNGASSPATVSQDFTDHADITIINMGGGVYRWYDNLYGAQDQPVGSTPTNYTPAADNTKAHLAAIDNALGVLGSTITGIDSAPIGTGQLWTTSDLANRPLNWMICDGNNGTPTGGTVGGMTAIIKGHGTVATPTVDIPAGTYTSTQNISLSSATAGSSIYYTVDGSDPDSGDTLYSSPVAVASSLTLKARADKSLHYPSAIFSATYVIDAGSSYIFADELLYADNTAFTTGGWVINTGSPVAHYTTSTISGFASSLKTFWGDSAYHTFTATANVSICVKLKVLTVSSSTYAVSIQDGTSTLAYVKFKTGGVVTFGFGTTEGGASSSTYSTATDYWLWMDRVKSTGVVSYYLSTTGTKPGSPTATCSTGFTSTDATRILLQAPTNATFIFNDVFVSDTPIGSNP